MRAVQLTTNNVSDSQVLGDLLNKIPLEEQIDFVYTDVACNTKYYRQMISVRPASEIYRKERIIKNGQTSGMSHLEKVVWVSSLKFGGN